MEGQAATGGRSLTARPGVGGWGEEAEGPRSGSLEWRASLALKVLAGIVAGIVLATIPGSIPAPELHAVAFNVISAALAVLYVLVALALDRRRDWAAAAVRPLLIVLLVWGTYSFGAALADGAVRIPFNAIAAGWALLGSADRKPLPRFRGRSAAVLGVSATLIALIVAAQPLFGWWVLRRARTRPEGIADRRLRHARCRPARAHHDLVRLVVVEWHPLCERGG